MERFRGIGEARQDMGLAALRRSAAGLAAELRDALSAHGLTVQVIAEPPMSGRAYVSILEPLMEEEVRVIADALREYRGSGRNSLSVGVAEANARSRRYLDFAEQAEQGGCAECRRLKERFSAAVRGDDAEAAEGWRLMLGRHLREQH
ncbi:hypothetical protein [Streptomyces orinoci]|uniref:Uncharacterized protein n=1 Tax=Streptomyces orinoci TaxID=67339 RepID=A0ABV3JXW0_STRON|nr:hypothetical protein [Streptomyces orinoci]